MRAYREEGFPVTIVRPSHTYDQTLLPMEGGYTVIDRMRRGKPVIVHGDGTSLWTLTHHRDFAQGLRRAAGQRPRRRRGVPHHLGRGPDLGPDLPDLRPCGGRAAALDRPRALGRHRGVRSAGGATGLLGDKTHSVVFDNSKIKRFVPDFAATIPLSWGAARGHGLVRRGPGAADGETTSSIA